MSQFVDYTADGVSCRAYLVRPAGAGPFATVLIAPTVRGPTALEHAKADALAAEGYLAIVIDHYGADKRDLGDAAFAEMNALLADRARLRRHLLDTLAFAQQVDGADAGRIAIIGYCFGGLCALDLARTGTSKVRAAVSVHGIFQPPALGDQPPIVAKILALHGWDDPLAPPEDVLSLTRELTAAGADWQLHAYGHTLHAFTNPDANMPGRGMYDAIATARANAAISTFLAEALV